MEIIQILSLIVLIIGSILGLLIIKPTEIVVLLSKWYQPRKFRVDKPDGSNHYYLQIKIFIFYYYIFRYKNTAEYTLLYFKDKSCIKYASHYIINETDINKYKNDRWEVIKFFSDTSNPKDTIYL